MKTQNKMEERMFHDLVAENMSDEMIDDKSLKDKFDAVMNSVQISPGKALDAGCGTGEFTAQLAKSGFEVVGVDISRKSIEFLNEYSNIQNRPWPGQP